MRRLFSLVLLVGGLAVAAEPAPSVPGSYEALHLVAIDGKPFDVARLRGHVVLFVNVASYCGYTPQYAGLQQLYERYDDKGFLVVGVPSNQFAGQEPGSNREIRNFCSTQYGVTFPLLEKQDVNGAGRSPLYRWLVGSRAGGGRDVGWNFEKFLVDRTGKVIGRWPSHVVPDDPHVVAAVEMALAR